MGTDSQLIPGIAAAVINAPGESALLPEPDPSFMPPPDGDPRPFERLYYDPAKWDAEAVDHRNAGDEDPVAANRGRAEGQATAALFISDFHMA